jgi:hypothetical protein
VSARTLRDWARSRLEVERSRRLDAKGHWRTSAWTDANARVQCVVGTLPGAGSSEPGQAGSVYERERQQ